MLIKAGKFFFLTKLNLTLLNYTGTNTKMKK